MTIEKASLYERFRGWQPTKATLFWTSVGSVAVVLTIGFTWGGWVTADTSRGLADAAGADARGQLASMVCVQRFLASPDADKQLVELKEITSSYQRREFIQKTGFATMPNQDSANRRASELCSEVLAELSPAALGKSVEATQ